MIDWNSKITHFIFQKKSWCWKICVDFNKSLISRASSVSRIQSKGRILSEMLLGSIGRPGWSSENERRFKRGWLCENNQVCLRSAPRWFNFWCQLKSDADRGKSVKLTKQSLECSVCYLHFDTSLIDRFEKSGEIRDKNLPWIIYRLCFNEWRDHSRSRAQSLHDRWKKKSLTSEPLNF